MGRRGPAPKPSEQKRLEGNPGKRALNKTEPEYEAEDELPCPKEIKGEGRLEWERIAPMLVEHGVLRKTDLRVFRNYCRVISDIDSTEKLLDKTPKAISHLKIYMYYQNMLIKLRTQARHYAQGLGLDPASRSAIKATRPKGKNGKDNKEAVKIPGRGPLLAFQQKDPGKAPGQV